MATDKVLMAWLQKLTQVRASSAATGYPAANVLDLDDLSEPWRSTDLTSEWLEFVAGQQVIGESAGVPESGTPVAAITKVKTDAGGRYVFAIENGVLRVWPWISSTGEFGTRLDARPGSTLTADNDVAVRDYAFNGLLYVAIGGSAASGARFEVYPLDPTTGEWGARYSDGASAATTTVNALCWQTGGATQIYLAHNGGDRVSAHPFDDVTGIGTKWTAPASSPAASNVLTIAHARVSSTDLAVIGHATSPRIEAYLFSDVSGWGAKHVAPTAIAGQVNGLAVTAATYSGNVFVAAAHNTSPFVSVLPLSTSAWGTKLANPASLPSAAGQSVSFRRGDTMLALSQDDASAPIVYAFTPTAGGSIGAKYSMFNPPSAAGGRAVAFSPDGKFLLAGHSTDPFLLTLPFVTSVVQASIGVVFVRWNNATAAATIRCRIGTDVTFVSNAFDNGTDPAFPSGVTDDTLSVYAPNIWIVLPNEATAEYMRLDFVDADNPDGFIEIGGVFAAPIFQPEINLGYGWTQGIDDLTRSSESESGHIVRQPRAKRRTLQLRLGFATEDEALDALHALMMLGSEQHVVVLPKPNEATGKMNFQIGILGHLVAERRIANPYHGRYEVTLTFAETLP